MLWRKRCLHVAAVMRIFTSGPSEYNRHRALKERPASRELYVRKFREYLVAIYSGLPVVFLVINNRRLGTIRVHQERHYPGRVVGTELHNPDFAKLAEAYGGRGFTVTGAGEFASAFEDALAARVPTLIDIQVP